MIKNFNDNKESERCLKGLLFLSHFYHSGILQKLQKKENVEMNIVENEVIKELNWREKIIVKLFAKTFNKVANLIRINTVNKLIN